MMIISLFGGVVIVIGGCLFVSLLLLVTGCAYVMYFLTLLE